MQGKRGEAPMLGDGAVVFHRHVVAFHCSKRKLRRAKSAQKGVRFDRCRSLDVALFGYVTIYLDLVQSLTRDSLFTLVFVAYYSYRTAVA